MMIDAVWFQAGSALGALTTTAFLVYDRLRPRLAPVVASAVWAPHRLPDAVWIWLRAPAWGSIGFSRVRAGRGYEIGLPSETEPDAFNDTRPAPPKVWSREVALDVHLAGGGKDQGLLVCARPCRPGRARGRLRLHLRGRTISPYQRNVTLTVEIGVGAAG